MKRPSIFFVLSLMLFAEHGADAQAPSMPDTSPHKVNFVAVDKDVKLEVLDWGGSGRPLIFLAGLGDTAHVFDSFAPKFTANHHVYAITRRGYGESSKPAPTPDNYLSDRLGDDVLEAIAALRINRPVLVGHSIAGEELSSIGSRHPEKVTGLIYLDAAGASGFYDSAQGNYGVDAAELYRRLDALKSPTTPEADKARMQELLQSGLLRQFETDLRSVVSIMNAMPPEPSNTVAPTPDPRMPYSHAIVAGQQRYTHINGPILAIMALPHDFDKDPSPEWKAFNAMNLDYATHQADAFQAAMPSAHVVRLPYADHYVYRSNEADVLREMNAFMATLP